MLSSIRKTLRRLYLFFRLLKKIGLDEFLLGIILMVILAYYYPAPGLKEGMVSIKGIANLGVSLIFYFYGLRLSPAKIKLGLNNWRLHLLIQSTTFLLFPIIISLIKPFFNEGNYEALWIGSFYMAALPSTVSSSVVMVSIAGGNLPAAIFNASFSSLIGIFLTPLWMSLIFTADTGDFNFMIILGKLIVQVLIPLILGILSISFLGSFAEKNKVKLKYLDQIIILMIVYSSFCTSFSEGMFNILDTADIVLLSFFMILLFFIVYGIVFLFSSVLNFNNEDRITALFCGSKKSLVQGTVMSKVLFVNNPALGLILLPIMIYHALQLVIASIIAQKMAKKSA